MELAQVEGFVEAQRRGSITRAAEALELTQPTLTARIRSLEAELGVALLVRGRRGVALTPAGRRFLPRAVAALDALGRASAEARAGRELVALDVQGTRVPRRTIHLLLRSGAEASAAVSALLRLLRPG